MTRGPSVRVKRARGTDCNGAMITIINRLRILKQEAHTHGKKRGSPHVKPHRLGNTYFTSSRVVEDMSTNQHRVLLRAHGKWSRSTPWCQLHVSDVPCSYRSFISPSHHKTVVGNEPMRNEGIENEVICMLYDRSWCFINMKTYRYVQSSVFSRRTTKVG
jgi:hypothetical protein